MARQPRRKQEQLSFPELALYDLPVVNPAMALVDISPSGPLALRESPGMSVSALPESKAPRVVRKRPGRPKMVLVKDLPNQSDDVGAAMAVSGPAPADTVSSIGPVRPAPDLPVINCSLPSAFEEQSIVEPDPDSSSLETANTDLTRSAGSTGGAGRVVERAKQSYPSSSLARRLKLWAQVSTIIASLVFVLVLIVGVAEFAETERRQRDLLVAQKEMLAYERNLKVAEMHTKASDLFLRYNELMQQVSAPLPKGARKELRYRKENLALSLLASLFDLTRGNREWEDTITRALERHGRILREQRLFCPTYSNQFVLFLEQVFAVRTGGLCKDQSAG